MEHVVILKDHPPETIEAVVKELVYLLWKAAGGPSGMGCMQDRPAATKDEVFARAVAQGDYFSRSHTAEGEIYMDYVFGRCLKTRVARLPNGTITISPATPRDTYQDWGLKYKDAGEAALEALKNLGLV